MSLHQYEAIYAHKRRTYFLTIIVPAVRGDETTNPMIREQITPAS